MNLDAAVIIPAKDAAKFLEASVESVANQKTSFSFEIIIVNDHSSDTTRQIADKLSAKHKNVRVINSQKSGISNALNTGIQLAECLYIIRHDADDIMLDGRIQIQLEFLSREENYVIIGGQIEPFGVDNLPRVNFYPLTDREIRKFSLIGNPFAHPTISFRLAPLKEIGLYRSEWNGAEDYDLWLRLLRVGKGANLRETVTKYRIHPGQVTSANAKKVEFQTLRLQFNNFKYMILNRQLVSALVCGLALVIKYTRNKARSA